MERTYFEQSVKGMCLTDVSVCVYVDYFIICRPLAVRKDLSTASIVRLSCQLAIFKNTKNLVGVGQSNVNIA